MPLINFLFFLTGIEEYGTKAHAGYKKFMKKFQAIEKKTL